MKWTLNFVASVLLALGSESRSEEVFLYVGPTSSGFQDGSPAAPFSEVSKALEAVAVSLKKAHYKIIVRAGTYSLSQPISIEPRHTKSSVRSLTIQGESPGHVFFRGGVRYSGGWTCNGGYCQASIPEEVRGVFLNGQLVPRSAWQVPAMHTGTKGTNTDPDWAKIVLPDDATAEFMNNLIAQGGVEVFGVNRLDNFAYWNAMGSWNSHLLRASGSVRTGKDVQINLQTGSLIRSATVSVMQMHRVYRLENLFNQMDGGTWAYRNGVLKIRKDILQGDRVDLLLNKDQPLLVIRGDEASKVRNVRLFGLHFQYSSARLPLEGHREMQVAHYSSDQGSLEFLSSAIEGINAQGVTLDRISVMNTGGNGITFGKGTKDLRILNSNLTSIGGSGIVVGEVRIGNWEYFPSSHDQIEGILISNNSINQIGRFYRSQAGIFTSYSRHVDIRQNEVTDVPYAGISVGWGWGNPNPSKNIQVYRNRLTKTCYEFWDCGAIYMLGVLGGPSSSIVRGNVINDWVGNAAIYQDHASAVMLDSNFIGSHPTSQYGNWLYLQHLDIPVTGSIAKDNRCPSPFGYHVNENTNVFQNCAWGNEFSFPTGLLDNAFIFQTSQDLLSRGRSTLFRVTVPTTGSQSP